MTIQTTRWSPDSCQCIIEYQWDDSVPSTSRTHTLANYIRKCSAHATQANDSTRWNTVLEENPRKNIAYQLIVDNAPLQFVDTDANGIKTLKAGLSINFTVSGTVPNRVFTMTFSGTTLTQAQIDNVQSKLDTRFGAGKVIFVNTP
jgi:hypothetical protein